MNKEEVNIKVIQSADRFGYSNKQQFFQLEKILIGCEPQVVFEGLINVFKVNAINSDVRQELAGRLLYRLNPEAVFDLCTEVKACLSCFDLSVEHLPFYFVKQFSIDEVTKVCREIKLSSLTERENEALGTMEFWLKNYDEWKAKNG